MELINKTQNPDLKEFLELLKTNPDQAKAEMNENKAGDNTTPLLLAIDDPGLSSDDRIALIQCLKTYSVNLNQKDDNGIKPLKAMRCRIRL